MSIRFRAGTKSLREICVTCLATSAFLPFFRNTPIHLKYQHLMEEKTKPHAATADAKPSEPTAMDMARAGLNEAEFQHIKSTYKYPVERMQQFMLDFVQQLKTEKHHIYAVLVQGSDWNLRIFRFFDWKLYRSGRGKQDGPDGWIPLEAYHIDDIKAMGKTLHHHDRFFLTVFGEQFDQDKVVTVAKTEKLYWEFLRTTCEASLRRGEQMRLTPEMIRDYDLTPEDVVLVRKDLNRYNFECRNKIQQEYDALKVLPCIKK